MKNLVASILLALMASIAFGQGIVIGIENDILHQPKSDNNYSHATEMFYMWHDSTSSNVISEGIGLRQRMYSSDDINRTYVLPSDRPWCGVSTVVYQQYRGEKLLGELENVRYEVEVGVLGPLSMADKSQTYVHRIINNDLPKGWDTQMPNEPMINFSMERRRRQYLYGDPKGWQTSGEVIYGLATGTTYDYLEKGMGFKMGWNIPDFRMNNIIAMKASNPNAENSFFAYLFFDFRSYTVLHNATMGTSFFQSRENERVLYPEVFERMMGITVGWKYATVSYYVANRTKEFYGQAKDMDYGGLRFEIGRTF